MDAAPLSLSADDAQRRIAELERDNAKLRKINTVLIDRVERSMDFQGNAFSLFQTAIVLEGRVRDRTVELENALRELGKSNRALHLAKEEAETAQMRLATAIESVSEGFILCDAEDRLVMCNSKYREFWPGLADIIHPGVPFRALVHHAHMLGLFDDGEAQSLQTSMKRRLQHHRQPQEMFVLKLTDGRWLQISERRTADGGSVAIYTDITEIKLSEQRQREFELAEKSALLQAIFDNISQGISVVDHERRLVAWNQRFLDLLSITADEIAIGQPLRDLIHLPAIRCQFLHAGFGPTADDVGNFCMEQMTDSGRVLEVQLGPMPGGGIVTTYTDITERKASEWALRDSEQRIRLITDAMPALIAYVDSGQRYRFTNKPYEDWFGRPRSEINGRQMRSVLGDALYNDRRHAVETVLSGQKVTFEIALPLVNGLIEVAQATYVPHFGADGEVLGFFALIQDITERKRAAEQLLEAKENLELRVFERTAELTTLNRQLKQEVEERRLAEAALRIAKGEAEQANMSKTKFIAAASHDLLQPLNAARVFAAALGESRMAPHNRGLVNNVGSALNSVDELLSALLDISKLDAGGQTPEISDLCIDGLLESLAREHLPQAKARQLALRWVPSGAVVRTDPVLVGRILRNFLSNAMRYTPAGTILLGCRRRADGLEVQVWDSGTGIPADKLKEVFDEFRRLAGDSHGKDRGMGLGLAIVDRIARCLNHPIGIRSTLGRGSMFSITLPYGNSQKVKPQDSPFALPATIDRVAGTLVMVIENDRAALEGMQALLHSWRCTVIAASDADAALSQLHQRNCVPDVLLADYHLDDDATGLQALAAIQALFPQPLPGVIITADRSDEMQSAVRKAGYHLLNKPLKPARLRSLLAHLSPTAATPR
jgi:PAS domain S-box-containing protein